MKYKIAIVEDEEDISELIKLHFEKAGFSVQQYYNGTDFMMSLEKHPIDLVILDIMLPDLMGTDICRKLRSRKETEQIAILMLTAKTEEIDKIIGLELGADDYLTKPFSPRELVARVNAILRRVQGGGYTAELEQNEIVIEGVLRIIPARYQVFVKDEEVRLTKTEFTILLILATRKGWVYSRDQLLESLWGDDKIVTGRTIDVHIKNLRNKLKSAGAYIVNVVGVGYKLNV